eukprot:TRINITY_DN25124_c0_g2_i1.p1 TRINITY_DN25124_c0_g2~~TRINITY_DN25124_c0_g2_i1.p1  ORF type:complete len:436 (+),score=90.45 TRINITY_DN25124_c0_g2_i1:88-1308(+)
MEAGRECRPEALPSFLQHLKVPQRFTASRCCQEENTWASPTTWSLSRSGVGKGAKELKPAVEHFSACKLTELEAPSLPDDDEEYENAAECDAAFGVDSRETPDLSPKMTMASTPSDPPVADLEGTDDTIDIDAPSSSTSAVMCLDFDEARTKNTKDKMLPKAPILKFRAQCNFSSEFKSEEQLQVEKLKREARRAAEDERHKIHYGREEINDFILGWANQYFALEVKTENHFHAAFPLIVLLMIDVIYPKKVSWHRINWNAGAPLADQKNHALLQMIWYETNMDKLQDFRTDGASTRIEHMVKANTAEKLVFFKSVKRWFDRRVRSSEVVDPMTRLAEIDAAVRRTGRYAKFPAWMKYDASILEESIQHSAGRRKARMTATTADFDQLPEFKRLFLFLGSADHTRL